MWAIDLVPALFLYLCDARQSLTNSPSAVFLLNIFTHDLVRQLSLHLYWFDASVAFSSFLLYVTFVSLFYLSCSSDISFWAFFFRISVYFKHRPPTQNLHLTRFTSCLLFYTVTGHTEIVNCTGVHLVGPAPAMQVRVSPGTLLTRDMHAICGNWWLSFKVAAVFRIQSLWSWSHRDLTPSGLKSQTKLIAHTLWEILPGSTISHFLFYVILFGLFNFISTRGTAIMKALFY